MAAVIAHEVKNPLAGIRGAIQVIGGRLPKDSKDALITQEIISRIDALNELMKDLLLFARPPQPKPLPVELTTLVTTTADLLSADPALKGRARRGRRSAPPVLADPELLKIVFVNLLVNGAHAMNGQGIVRVAIEPHGSLSEVEVQRQRPGHSGGRPCDESSRRSSRRNRADRASDCRPPSVSSKPITAPSTSTARRPAAPR